MMTGSPFARRTQRQFLQDEVSLNAHRDKIEDSLLLLCVNLATILKQYISFIGQNRSKETLYGHWMAEVFFTNCQTSRFD
jgi:hypothetical protein